MSNFCVTCGPGKPSEKRVLWVNSTVKHEVMVCSERCLDAVERELRAAGREVTRGAA